MKRDSTVTEWSHLPTFWSTDLPTPSMHCQMCACRILQVTLDPSCLSSHSWSWRSSELSPQILWGGDKPFPLGCVQIPNPVICECDKMVTLQHWVWGGLLCSNNNWRRTGDSGRSHHFPMVTLPGNGRVGIQSSCACTFPVVLYWWLAVRFKEP